MNSTTSTRHASIRAFFVAIALLIASILASNPASAGTLIPMVDMGAPGGGGGTATETIEIAGSAFPGVRES